MSIIKQQNPIEALLEEGVVHFNALGLIVQVNKSVLRILKYYKKDLVGVHVDDIFRTYFDSTLILRSQGIAETTLKKKITFSLKGEQAFLVSKTGKKVPVFVNAYPSSEVTPEGGVLVFRDMSEEKSLSEYKQDTLRRLHMLTPVLQKMSVGDFSQAIDIPDIRNEFTELFVALQMLINDQGESTQKSSGGFGHAYEEEGWQLIKMAGKKTTELKEAKSHMETIFENLSNGLIEFDASFRVRRINASAEKMIGLTRDEIMGQKVKPEDLHKKKKWESIILVSYPILDSSVKKLKKDIFGKDSTAHLITIHQPLERQLEVITAPLVDHITGVREGFIKVLNDVTRERMIAKSKSEFISVAAHQLRTPLSGMKWVIRLILDEDIGKINNDQKEMLQKGYDTNEKMIRLVNDLLNVARIEDGRFGYIFKVHNINTLVESVVDGLNINAQDGGISLRLESKGDIKPFVFDESKMELVIQNLVGNAVKYTPEGGTVLVRLSVVDGNAQVEVSDTGIGIPKEQIPRMFSKFFRAENAVKTQVTGSGLGLFIVKNILARHGGKITVKSIENEGSVFIFSIPMDEDLIPQSDVLDA